MAFSFVNGSNASVNGGTSLTLTVPAGVVAGDLLIYAVCCYNTTITLPSGVTSLASGQGAQTPHHQWNFGYKVAGASEPSGTVSFAASTWGLAVCYALRGAASSAPVPHIYTKADATAYVTSLPAASGALASASDATVYIYGGSTSTDSGTGTLTFPAGLANGYQATASANGGVLGVAWGTDVTAPGAATSSIALDYYDALLDVAPSAPALLPPAGLTATPASGTRIDLSWTAATGATGYDIERGGTVVASGLTGTSWSDTGLTPSTTYTYNIRSVA